jgi:hypothetical protein
MRRFHGVELCDFPWFPSLLRDAATEYLRFSAELAGQPAAIWPIIESALERSDEQEILDLCSGGGGPMLWMVREFSRRGLQLPVTLSDLYPSAGARELVERVGAASARYDPEPVDALDVPGERRGLRTIVNAFHHFRPEQAERVLASSVEARRPIAVIEVTQRRLLHASLIAMAPLALLLVLPLLRPFRPAWLPLTYLIPAIPLLILWDGLTSCLRCYTANELLALAGAADPGDSFEWHVEQPRMTGPVRGIALVGIPRALAGH